MNLIKLLLLSLALLFSTKNVYAHDGHIDRELIELNDYLMAIQLLKDESEVAQGLFLNWQQVRSSSWEIRALTEKNNLLANSEQVKQQVKKTKLLRRKLLSDIRDYFEARLKNQAHVLIKAGKNLDVSWGGNPHHLVVNASKLVLIKVENSSHNPLDIALSVKNNDHILFWNKTLQLKAQSHQFTFAVLSPKKEGEFSHDLLIEAKNHSTKQIEFKVVAIDCKNTQLVTLGSDECERQQKLKEKKQNAYVHKKLENPHIHSDHSIKFNIVDKQSKKPLSVRIEVKDEADNKYWSPIKGASYAYESSLTWGWHTTLWDYQAGPYFYIDGTAELGVNPKGKKAIINKGFEYRQVEMQLPDNGQVNLALERWINMPALGWYSGQTHIHTTDIGLPVQYSPSWHLVSHGEDLHVSAILSLKGEWQSHAIYANEFPMGEREFYSSNQHKITYGQEFRNNPYGHYALLGMNSLLQPISTGALGELGGADYPANYTMLDLALAQGATTIAAHVGNILQEGELVTPWPSTGFEMPIDVALGKVDLVELYGSAAKMEVWYDLLNAGFKIPATAGPDWAIKDTPRAYVNLEGQLFNVDNWTQALKAGRSFVTTGPMLFFTVDDKLAGNIITVDQDDISVNVKSNASLPDQSLPVEIVFNGKVIASGSDISTNIKLTDSGWLAARTSGAHSNPVYFDFKDRPAGLSAPAKRFIGVIERLEYWVTHKAIFDNAAQKNELLKLIKRGRSEYEKIIIRARTLGRDD